MTISGHHIVFWWTNSYYDYLILIMMIYSNFDGLILIFTIYLYVDLTAPKVAAGKNV